MHVLIYTILFFILTRKETNMNTLERILPAFSEHNVPVVFSCDANFVPYLGVCIQSILNTISRNNNYDIIILEDKIPDWNKQRVINLKNNYSNVSIRFVNVTPYFEEYGKRFYIRDRYTLSTYARFFIPEILNSFHKVLYLDADIVVRRDIADLYAIDIQDNMIGAALDYAVHINWYAGKQGVERYKYAYDYLKNVAHYEDILGYFQAGVLILNLDSCRKNNLLKKGVAFFNYIEKPLNQDQDILNFIAKEKVKIINQKWNFQWHLRNGEYGSLKYLPYETFANLQEVFDDFYIIHYCSNTRPWTSPDEINACYFWDVARQTVFYEELLYANLNKKIRDIVQQEKHRLNYQPILDLVQLGKLRWKYWKYNIEKHLVFKDKKKAKYKSKAKEIKKRIKSVKAILKEHE